MTRDDLYEKMKLEGVFGRRYFYPLITDFEPYMNYPSASKANLLMANRMADSVVCLPMHHGLQDDEVELVVSILKGL